MMEEKVLIKSEPSKIAKYICIGVSVACLVTSFIFLLIWIGQTNKNWSWYKQQCWNRSYIGNYKYEYECEICGKIYETDADVKAHLSSSHWIVPFRHAFVGYNYGDSIGSIAVPILHWSFIGGIGIVYLMYWLFLRLNMTITDKNIRGRTFWGKEVVLPIYMVSSYSKNNLFSSVTVSTGSGRITFFGMDNYEKISAVLQQILNERQEKTVIGENLSTQNRGSNNLEDLAKLKTLLDDNIITQEEFEAKKKQLLGL